MCPAASTSRGDRSSHQGQWRTIVSPAVLRTIAEKIFAKQHFPNRAAIDRLLDELFAASLSSEEGVYLRASLIALSPEDSVERWRHVLDIATVHTGHAFVDAGLGTSLRRHGPLLEAADFGLVSLEPPSFDLIGVATIRMHGLGRLALLDRLRQTHSVLVEVFGPFDIRLDNGTSSIRLMHGHYRFPAEPEGDTTDAVDKVVAALSLGEAATTILERLIATLRRERHGALYVVTDDTANLESLFPDSIAVDWNALPPYAGAEAPHMEPTRIVNAYAGFGMMDGAVVLAKDLSLRRYRAYYEIEQAAAVEGGGRTRAYTALRRHIGEGGRGLVAAMKVSTDGGLFCAT